MEKIMFVKLLLLQGSTFGIFQTILLLFVNKHFVVLLSIGKTTVTFGNLLIFLCVIVLVNLIFKNQIIFVIQTIIFILITYLFFISVLQLFLPTQFLKDLLFDSYIKIQLKYSSEYLAQIFIDLLNTLDLQIIQKKALLDIFTQDFIKELLHNRVSTLVQLKTHISEFVYLGLLSHEVVPKIMFFLEEIQLDHNTPEILLFLRNIFYIFSAINLLFYRIFDLLGKTLLKEYVFKRAITIVKLFYGNYNLDSNLIGEEWEDFIQDQARKLIRKFGAGWVLRISLKIFTTLFKDIDQ